MNSVDEMINDAVEFEEYSNVFGSEWSDEVPCDIVGDEACEVIDLTSPNRRDNWQNDNNNIDSQNLDKTNAQQDKQQDEDDCNDEADSANNTSECDDLQRRRGVKRRLHTFSEWSSSSRSKMLKQLVNERH